MYTVRFNVKKHKTTVNKSMTLLNNKQNKTTASAVKYSQKDCQQVMLDHV